MKCIKCGQDLKITKKEFTGTCNFNKGQYIYFWFCDNKDCDRYKLFVDYNTTEK